MSRPIGLPKTGGRTKGTPNKRTLEFRAILEEAGFSIPKKALELYAKAEERNELDLSFKILDFMAGYVHSKFKNVEDAEEVAPQQQTEAQRRSTEDLLRRMNWAIEMEMKFPKEAAEVRRIADAKYDMREEHFTRRDIPSAPQELPQ